MSVVWCGPCELDCSVGVHRERERREGAGEGEGGSREWLQFSWIHCHLWTGNWGNHSSSVKPIHIHHLLWTIKNLLLWYPRVVESDGMVMTAVHLYCPPCEVLSGLNVRFLSLSISLIIAVSLSVTALSPTPTPLHLRDGPTTRSCTVLTIHLNWNCSSAVALPVLNLKLRYGHPIRRQNSGISC